jgi:hypothetical protein
MRIELMTMNPSEEGPVFSIQFYLIESSKHTYELWADGELLCEFDALEEAKTVGLWLSAGGFKRVREWNPERE